MNPNLRQHSPAENDPVTADVFADGGGHVSLTDIRSEAEEYSRMMEEVIGRALSGDSQSFIRDTQQASGQ